MDIPMSRPKVVPVRAYERTRHGRLEHVSAYLRSLPRQLTLGF